MRQHFPRRVVVSRRFFLRTCCIRTVSLVLESRGTRGTGLALHIPSHLMHHDRHCYSYLIIFMGLHSVSIARFHICVSNLDASPREALHMRCNGASGNPMSNHARKMVDGAIEQRQRQVTHWVGKACHITWAADVVPFLSFFSFFQ